jgi:hypothetical protein
MPIPAAQDVSLGFIPGDHVCAFQAYMPDGSFSKDVFAAESELAG